MKNLKIARGAVKNQPSCLQNLSYYFTEYSESTSIHGLKFLGERKRSIVEKIWWLVFLTISLCICLLLIAKTYRKWENSPVIVTFATSETPVWKIPFPAVTVCPLIKRTGEHFYSKLNTTLEQSLEYLDLICPKSGYAYESVQATTNDDMINFLMTVQSNYSNFIYACYWLENECNMEILDSLKPVLTSDGICYSFNILDREEIFTKQFIPKFYESFAIPHQPPSRWSLEGGYVGTEPDTFPTRTFASGAPGGLELLFRTEFSDDNYICQDFSQGYKIVLHHPAQVPDTRQRYIRVGLAHDVSASVKVNMMTTSEELRDYHPKERKCYFSSERHLRFFKVYSQHNCLLECLTNFTYKRCGCVNFYMPRNDSMPICGLGKIWCLKVANDEFLKHEVELEIKQSQSNHQGSNYMKTNQGCDCLPSCYSLDFDAEISQTEWAIETGNGSKYGYLYDTDASFARVQIYFKDMQFMTLQRNELYGLTNFLASCGGLLGLFTGFSVISLVEIAYYVTLRFICNCRRYGRHYWSGANELLESKT